MKALLLLTTCLLSASVFSAEMNTTQKRVVPKFRKYTENLSFNYSLQFLGPSLSNDYQDGATYNRFKTGQDIFDQDQDATASYQYYHAISIGYQLMKDYKLSYSYTFQDDINKDIEYDINKFDGSTFKGTRARGVSDNNKRINLFVSDVYSNKNFYINTNYFYELASTNASIGEEREYGLGFEPSIGFIHDNSALSTGVGLSIQRNYFKNNVSYPDCGGVKCALPNRYQTLLVSVTPYLNYYINDYTIFKSSLIFDWDQKGEEVNSSEKFNKNMDDVARVGVDFNIDYGMYAGTFLEMGIEEASLKKTALGLNFSISLY